MFAGAMGFAVCIAVLLSASVSDARTRTVPDMHWLVMGIAGMALHSMVSLRESTVTTSASVALGSAIILSYILSERMSGIRAIPLLVAVVALFVSQYFLNPGDPFSVAGLAILVASFLMLAMYRIGLIRGGADAKALVVMAISVPTYSEFPGLPLLWEPPIPGAQVIVPVLGILVLALLMSLASAVPIAIRNLGAGDVGIHMFSSYRIPLSEAAGRFVWPLEDVQEGRVVGCRAGDDSDERLARLAGIGAETVRVTPMIPFMIPLTASFIIVTVIGNPIFALTV